MALPLMFIGVAAATGIFGGAKTAHAFTSNNTARKINKIANKNVSEARDTLEMQREEVSQSLENLGQIKIDILNGNVMRFLDTFEKIKNVDFSDSLGLQELKNLHITEGDFKELKELGNFAAEVAGGAGTGVIGGALTAFGAYGAAASFGSASTGTAIATLHGAAATNATLAFFGGGSVAAGGLGMAGGVVVLGGLVAGPALAVMGIITDAGSQKKVETALANKAESDEIVESLKAAGDQCIAIRRRSNMFFNMLAYLDSCFLPLIVQMEEVYENEGDDYRQYKTESRKIIASAAATAVSIKSILDTTILTSEGELTEESEEVLKKIEDKIYA